AVRDVEAGRDRDRVGHRSRPPAARRAVVGHGAGGSTPAGRRAARPPKHVRPFGADDRAPRPSGRAGLRLRVRAELRPAADGRLAGRRAAPPRGGRRVPRRRGPGRRGRSGEARGEPRKHGRVMAFLEVRGLRVGYGAIPVLQGIDFDVEEGKTTVLLGLNGAGKTTTVATVAGLLKPSVGTDEARGDD